MPDPHAGPDVDPDVAPDTGRGTKMDNSGNGHATQDLATPVMCLVFAAIGGIVIWDTTTYTDADSYVFPRTIAIAMILLSAVCIGQWMLGFRGGDANAPNPIDQGVMRRVALAAAMLGAGLLMPMLGFLLTGVIVFAAILLAAMHDPWTPFRAIVYPVAGVALICGFYFVFANGLQVPLPKGTLGLPF